MLTPTNKYLLVEVIKEQKKESGILIPEECQAEISAYSLVKLIQSNENSDLNSGIKLIVPTHILEHVEMFGEKYTFVLENNVIGYFNN